MQTTTETETESSLPAVRQKPFDSAVTPKVLTTTDELFMFKYACGNTHMRHAGYIELVIPFMRPDKQAKVEQFSRQVNVCTRCKKCYIWNDNQMYDVTALIDLEAWTATEEKLHKATGPGGQC